MSRVPPGSHRPKLFCFLFNSVVTSAGRTKTLISRAKLTPTVIGALFFLHLAHHTKAQIAAGFPAHTTLDQRTVQIRYNSTNGNMHGSGESTDFVVRIGASVATSTPVPAAATTISANGITFSAGTVSFGAFPTGTPVNTQSIYVRFDATGITAGHPAYLLPGENIYLTFTNSGNTLRHNGTSDFACANYTNLQSTNAWAPSATGDEDFNTSSEGNIGILDQCSPVNTSFYRWTYAVSLRFRNSTRFVIGDQKLNVSWNGPPNTVSVVTGYLSDNTGTATSTAHDALFDGFSNPRTFITYRALGVANGEFSYNDNTGTCNFNATGYPQGVTVGAAYNSSAVPTLQLAHQFNSYDYDDQNTGALELDIVPINGTTVLTNNLVCLGTNVQSQYSDNSVFNCEGAGGPPQTLPVGPNAAGTPINSEQRWIRFVYGGINSPLAAGNIRDVVINGEVVTTSTGALDPDWDAAGHPILPGTYTDTSPTAGTPVSQGYVRTGAGGINVPDANGVIQLSANAVESDFLSEIITTSTTANHAIDQRFYVTIQYWGVCNPYPTSEPVQETVDYIEIIQAPAVPTAANRDICSSESRQLSVSPTVGGVTYNWSLTSGGASVATGANFTPSNGQAPAGTINDFFVTATLANGCVSAPDQADLKRRSALSNAGLSIVGPSDLCPNSSYSFSVNNPPAAGAPGGEPTQYRWTLPAGWTITPVSGIGQNVTLTTGATTGSQTITVTYEYVNVTSNSTQCGVTFTASPNVRARPTVGITPDPINICEGNSLLINGNPVLSFGAISSHSWGIDAATILDNPAIQTPTILASTPFGSYNLSYSVTANYGGGVFCSSATDNIAVSISDNTLPADAGMDQNLCQPLATPANLAGSSPAPGTGTWTRVSGPGAAPTFLPNANAANATVTVSANGLHTFRWTVVNGACSSFDDVVIDFGTDPGAQNAGLDNTVCGLVATMAATAPIVGTISWSLVSGPSAPVFAPGNTINSTATVTAYGTYVFRMSVTSGICVVRTDDVQIIYHEPATANSGAGFTNCQDGAALTAIPLSGTIGGGSTPATGGRWERVTGTGTMVSSGTATGNVVNSLTITDSYMPSAADFTAGSVQVRVVAIDPDGAGATNPCANVNGATITITIDRRPASINADVDGNVANNLTCTSSFVLGAAVPTNGGTGTWTGPAGVTFTPSATNPAATANNLPLTGGVPTLTTLTWTVTSVLGVCAPQVSTVDVTRYPLPTANVITPQLCDDVTGAPFTTGGVDLSTYSALVSNGAVVDWYLTAADRTAGTPKILAPITVTNGQTLFFRATSAAPSFCINDGSTTFTVNALPAAIDQSGEFCESSVGSGIASGINLTSFEAAVRAGAPAGNRDIEWYEDDGGGGLGALIPPGAGVGQESNYAITATKIVHARVIDLTSPVTPDCFDVADVTLTYKPRPINNIITGDAVSCTSATAIKIYQVNPTLNSFGTDHRYTWTITPGPGSPGPGTVDYEVVAGGGVNTTNFFILIKFPGPNTGDIDFDVFETIDGCQGNTVNFEVEVAGAPPALAFAAPATQVCKGATQSYSLTGANPGSTYNWTVVGGTINGSATTIGSATISVTWGSIIVPQPSVSVTETSSSGCSGAPASINVFLNDNPVMNSATSATICGGATPGSALTFSALVGGAAPAFPVTFNWRVVSFSANLSGIIVNQVGTGNIGVPIINTSGIPGTATFEVIPSENEVPNPPNCAGVPQTVTITVLPQPVVAPAQSKTICSDSPANYKILLTPSALPATSMFSWPAPTMSAGPAQGTASPMGGVIQSAALHLTDVLNNTTGADITATYFVTATDGSCVSSVVPVVITIQPEPVGVVLSPTRCSDEVFGAAVTLSTAGGSVAASAYNISINSNGLTFSGGTASGGNGKAANELVDDSWTNTTAGPVNVVYTVTPVSAATCVGDPFLVTVTINPEPIGVVNPTLVRCSDVALGAAYALSVSGSGVGASTYNISVNPNGLTFSGLTPAAPTGNPANVLQDDSWTNTGLLPVVVTYTVAPVSALGCAGNPYNVLVSVDPEPVGNPIVQVTRCSDVALGAAYTLSSSSAAVPAATYNIVVNPNGLTFSGSTASGGNGKAANELIDDSWRNTGLGPVDVTYTITPVSAASCQGEPYDVIVTINPEPVGNAIPQVSRCSDVAIGNAYTLSSSGASIAAASYNIIVNANGLLFTGTTASGGNNKAANELEDDSWTNAGTAAVVVTYTVTPVSADGCLGNPYDVTVSINPEPTGNAISQVSRCSDTALGAAYTLSSSPAGVAAASYNIVINANGLTYSGPTPSAGNGMAATELTDDSWRNTTLLPVVVTYTITPVSALGCLGNPYDVSVSVDPEPVGTPIVQVSRCSDVVLGAYYTLASSGASVAAATYNITVNPNGLTFSGTTASAGNGKLATELLDDSWTNTGTTAVVVTYSITPVSAAGCLGNPYNVTVSVDPEPVGNPITQVVRCSDVVLGAAYTLTSSGASVAAANYNITVTPNGLTFSGTTPSAGTGMAATELLDDAWTNTGLVPVVVTYGVTPVSAIGCLGNPYNVNVSIDPEPVGNPIVQVSRCSDAALGAAYTLSSNGASVAATTYNIAVNANGLTYSGASPSGGAGRSATELVDDSWTNTGLAAVVVTYTITPVSAGGCLGNPYDVTVSIDPEPVGTAIATVSRCSDTAIGAAYTLTSEVTSVAASTYNITVNSNGLVFSGTTASGGNNKAANELVDDAWTNTGLIPVTVTYTIVPVSAIGCQGNPYNVSVSIDPEPVGTPVSQVSRCSDIILGAAYLLSSSGSSVSAATYTIGVNPNGLTFSGTTPSGGTLKAANELIDDAWTNTTTAPVVVSYTITPVSAAGCSGNPYNVTVSVDPEPVGNPIAPVTRCSDVVLGAAYTLTSSGGSVAAATYNITVNPNGLAFSGTTSSTGSGKLANELLDDSWTNTGMAPVVVTYSIVPVSAIGCLGNSYDVTVSIDPEPVGTPVPQVLRCSDVVLGAAYALSSSGASVAAANYNIVVNANGLTFSGATPSGGVGQPANILEDDSWTNTGLVPVVVTYTVTPVSAAGCLGNPYAVTVVVDPEPVGTAIVQVSRCSDASLGAAYTLTSSGASVAAATYNITVNPNGLAFSGSTPVTPTNNPSNVLIDDAWTNTGTLPVVVTYTVTPVSSGGCLGNPYNVTVSIDPEPVGDPIATVSRCSDTALGAAYTLTSSAASVGAASYNISVNSNGLTFSGTTASGGNNKAANELVDDAWTNTGLNPVTVSYTITPVSAAGCLGNPYVVSVSVDPEPVGNSIAQQSRCSDTVLGAVYTLSSSGASVAAALYNITVANGGLTFSGTTPSAGLGMSDNELVDDAWTNTGTIAVVVTYTITPVSAAGCLGNPYTVAVSVDPEPVGNAIAQVSRCSDVVLGAAYTLTSNAGSVAAASYNITVNAGGLTFSGATPVTPTGNAAGTLVDDRWTNTGAAPVVVIYTVSPVSSIGCVGNPYNVQVSIDPEPVGVPIVQEVRCSDVILGAAYTLTTVGGGVAANDYNITVNPNGLTFSGGTPVAPTGNTATVLLDDSWTNTGLLPVTVTYTVTPVSAAGCLGDPYVVSVSIDPEPVGTAITQVSRCSDVVLGAAYTLSSSGASVPATSFNITVNANGLSFSGGTPVAPTGNLATILTDDSWTNTGNSPVVVTYTVTPVSLAGCLGTPYNVSVSIDPEPVGTPIATVTRCSDVALGAAYTLSNTAGSAPAVSYNITVNSNGLLFSGLTPITPTGNTAGILIDDSWTNTGLSTVTVTYTVTPVSADGCLGNPYAVSVDVDPEPVGNPIVQVSRCSDVVLGAAYTLSSSGSSVAAATYNITVNNGGLTFSGLTPALATGNAANILVDDSWTNTGLVPVVVAYTVTPVSGAGCLGTPFVVNVSVDPEPVGNAIVQVSRCSDTALGGAYTLTSNSSSVAATTYNITVNSGGLVFSGATPITPTGNPSTTLTDDAWTNTGLAAVVVTYSIVPVSSAGCLGNSYDVTVSVDPEPVGVPIATVTRCSDVALGAAYTLTSNAGSVAAASYNISINSGVLVFSGATPAAATGNTGNILIDDSWTNTTTGTVTVVYTITPVSGAGCLGNPYTVSVDVDPEPVGNPIVQVSRCSDIVLGAAYTLSSNGASVAAATYNISINNGGLAFTGTGIPAATGNAANVLIDDAWRNTGLSPVVVAYTVTPVSAAGCLGNPYVVNVSVDPEPVGNPIAQVSRCSDTALGAAYALSGNAGSVAPATYNITVNSGGLVFSGLTPVTPTGNPSNVLTDDSWTNTGLAAVIVTYSIVPVSSAGCLGDSYDVTVSVDPEPVGTPVPQVTRCSDVALGAAYALTSAGGSVAAASYNIIVNSNGLAFSGLTPAAATGNAGNILEDDSWTNTTLAPVVVTYTVTPVSGAGCLGDSYFVRVTVDPEPVGNAIPQLLRCSDVVLGGGYTLSSSGASVAASTYNITINTNGLTFTGTGLPAATGNASNVLVDDAWRNTGLTPVVVTYTVTPVSAAGCLGNPYDVTVSISPEPVGDPIVTVSRCSDVQLGTAYALTSSGTATPAVTYNITVANGGLTFSGATPVTATGNASNVLVDDSWTNTGTLPVDVQYTITPVSALGCLGDPYVVTVTIDPEPVGIAIATVARCSDEALGAAYNLTFNAGSVAAATFNITVSAGGLTFSGATPVTATGNAAGTLADDSWRNVGLSPVLVTYTVTPVSAAGCLGTTYNVSVNINPEPVGALDVVTECSSTLNYDIQASNINMLGNSLPSVFTYTVSSSNEIAVPTPPALDRTVASNANITDSYSNTSGSPVIVTYQIIPYNAAAPGCAGTMFEYRVTISPTPVGAPSVASEVCSDVGFDINPQGNIAFGLPSTFAWTVAPDPLLTVRVAKAPQTGNLTETYTNVTDQTRNVVYTITPTAAGSPCVGAAFTITVPISAEPVMATNLNVTQCSDISYGVLLNTNGASIAAANYDITADVSEFAAASLPATPSTGLARPANHIQADAFTNPLATQLRVIYTVIPNAAPNGMGAVCKGDALAVEFRVNPEPVINPALATGNVECSDVAIGLVLNTNGTSVAASKYIYTDLQAPLGVTIPPAAGNAVPDPVETGSGDRPANVLQADKYTNLTSVAFDRFYLVKPKSPAGCIGDQLTITVSILPEPDFNFGIPAPLCSDDNINLQLLQAGATPVVASYQITDVSFDPGLIAGVINNAPGTYPATAGNYTVIGTYTNPTATILSATYKAKAIAVAVGTKQCVGDEKTGVVQIKPSPAVLTTLDKAACNDTPNNITITTTTGSALAGSFEIIRDPLPAGLTANIYTPGTIVVTGAATNNIGPDRVINGTDNPVDLPYRVRANTDAVPASGCYGPEEIIIVKVEPQFRVTLDATTNLSPLICSGQPTNIVMSSPSNPSTGVVTFNFSGVSGVPGAVTGLTPGFGLNEGDVIGDPGTFPQTLVNNSNNDVVVTYTVTPKAGSAGSTPGGCNGTASMTTVTVHPKPKVTVPVFKTICENTAVAIALNSPTVSTPAVSFNYTAAVDAPGAAGDVTGFAASGTFANNTTINDVLVNTTTSSRMVTYTLTPVFGTCVGDNVTSTVTVSPRPVLNPLADFEICTGEVFNPVAITYDTDPSTTLVTWTVTPVAGVTGAVNGSGDQFTQVLFNSANDARTLTYTFTATNVENLPQCAGATETLDLTVYPTPTITGVPSSRDVCFGATVTIPLASNKLNTVYDWTVDNNSDDPDLPEIPNGSASGASPAINQTFFNNGADLKSYGYTITPYILVPSTGAHCTGPDKTLLVNVAPQLTASLANASGGNEVYLCTGSKDFLYFTFTGHPNFDYTYTEGATVRTVTKKGFVDLLQVQPTTTTTYTLTSAKDAFGCQTNFNQAVTVFVDEPDADFTVAEDPIQCGPFLYHFNYNRRGDVTYSWKWGDGTEETEFSTTNPPAADTKQHLYTNLSPSSTARFRVTMETYLDTTKYIGGCLKRNTIDVRLHPQISAAVFPDKEVICSEEQVAFVNSSRGATIHKWFYRVQGSTAELDVRTTSVPANYRLPNQTASNPLILEVVYEANNAAGCVAAQIITPITVYRGVEAGFTHTPPTVFVGGSSVADFTNTSNPVDGGDFRYDWDFGLNANPLTPSGVGPFHVDYSTPGPKEIVLVATNILAEQNGLTCSDEFREIMEIVVPPLIADFTVTPEEACFPTDVTVTENLATGDKFEWRVFDDGGTAATSNAPLPVFKIPAPGIYTVELVTTNTFTGDFETTTREVTVYDLPMASFDVRPTVVYVPDSEINTFNFSDGATGYRWDFGDGTLSEEDEPSHTYKVEGAYEITLIALNDHGNDVVCYDTLVRKVTAKQGGVTRVPNAFTPNPNGPTGTVTPPGVGTPNTFNDVFLPQVKGAEEFNMQIFDRWGNLIFESNNANQGWDGYDRNGNLMPSGVYVFKLTLRLSDGQRTTQVGDITMIR